MSSMLEKLNQMKEEVSEKEITYPEMSESVHMENKEQPVQAELIIQQIKSLEQKLNNQSSLDKEQIKYMVSEMTSLSNLSRQSMKSLEEENKNLTKKLAESKEQRSEDVKKLNELTKGLKQEIKEMKEINYKKIEETLKTVSEQQARQQVNHSEILKVLRSAITSVERIDKLTWKDRVKQYLVELGATVAVILMILGAYHLATYLIK